MDVKIDRHVYAHVFLRPLLGYLNTTNILLSFANPRFPMSGVNASTILSLDMSGVVDTIMIYFVLSYAAKLRPNIMQAVRCV